MGTIGAPAMFQVQVPTAYTSSEMGANGNQTMYQDQAATPFITGILETTGAPTMYQAQAPPNKHEEWLELMRSGGGDLGEPVCSAFNGGTTLSSTPSLDANGILQPNPGTQFSYPWGAGDPGASSSAFPRM
jgi:hypothetical protein